VTAPQPTSVISRELLPASIALFTLVGLAAFENLGVAAALPELAAELGQVELLPWVITSYLIVSGVGTPLAGALIDALGLRVIFRTGVVVFIAGSVIAGLASTMTLLIAGRVVQGTGAGALVAVGLAGVNIVYPEHLVGRAFAANSTVWGVMGVAGPGLAALILTAASWEWIFFVNVPLGALALLVGWRVMPGRLTGSSSPRIDSVGLIMVLLFNVAVLFAVDQFGPWSAVWGALAGGLVVIYLRHARRHPEPVMKTRHLADPPYGLLAWSVSMLLAGGIAVQSFFTLYVRGGRGAGEALTAWSVFFFVIGWTFGANLSSRLLDRTAETTVMLIGFATTITSLAAVLALSAVEAPLWILFAVMTLAGSGIGMATNAALTLLRSVTLADESGRATSAHQFYRNLGFAVGAAVGGSVMLFVVARQIGDVEAVRELLAGAEGDGATGAAIADGFAAAAGAALGLAIVGMIPMRALRRYLEPARLVADEERRSHVRYVP